WFSSEQDQKGILAAGRFADFSLLSADYFSVRDEAIQDITSVLTVVAGKVVHGDGEYAGLAPHLPAPMPDWPPVRHFGGYQGTTLAPASGTCATVRARAPPQGSGCTVHGHGHAAPRAAPPSDYQGFWGALG